MGAYIRGDAVVVAVAVVPGPRYFESVSLAERIASARSLSGLEPAEVARLARVEPARLAAIEGGANLSAAELIALADALGVSPVTLLGTERADPRRSAARFRAPLGFEMISSTDARALARAAEAGRIHAFLWEKLGRPASVVTAARKVTALTARPAPWKQGYVLGEEARLKLAPTEGPITSLQGWLEEAGVLVLELTLEARDVEAASLAEAGASPVIILNHSVDRVRYAPARRAILAHELCHLLHDANGDRDLLTLVSRQNDTSDVEQRANGFAPAFLAPGRWVGTLSGTPRSISASIARRWGLSFEGAAWHAKNLGLLTGAEARALRDSPRKPAVETGLEQPIARTPPEQFGIEVKPSAFGNSQLGELAVLAACDEIISRGRAAEIVSFR